MGDRGSDRAVRGFTGTDRIGLRTLDHVYVHHRYLAEVQDRVFGPAMAGDARRIETDALFQHPARRLDRAALDLVDDAVRIDRLADVDRDRERLDADVFLALDLGDDRAIGAGILITGEADAITDARFGRRLPVRPLGGGPDDILCPLVGEMAEPERDRVFAALDGDFIEKRFDREHVALRAEGAQRGGTDRHRQQPMA